MAFSSSPLMEAFGSFQDRFGSPAASPTKTETDFPADVDQSFNSSMSFSTDNSPCARSPTPGFALRPISPLPTKGSHFLSPTPSFSLKPRRPDPVPLQSFEDRSKKPISTSTSGRMFGREISLNARTSAGPGASKTASAASKGMMLPPSIPEGSKASSSRPRGGLPMQWTSSNEERTVPKLSFTSTSMQRRDSAPSPRSSSSEDCAMDIDSPFPKSHLLSHQSPTTFSGAASYSGSPDLGSFFCESPAPPMALPPAKRRSLVASSPASPSSSPSAKRAALGNNRNLDKVASCSATLFGNARPNTLGSRRPQPYKRPTLASVPGNDAAHRAVSTSSAYPILYGPSRTLLSGPMGPSGTMSRAAAAPMRRAFSVCDQTQSTMPEAEEDESEFDNSPSMASTHAEYARRHGKRVIPRIDGSPGFRPMRQSIAATGEGVASPVSKGKKVSPYGPGGLPGFGDNEMDGKILPCHKVKEDGLVRITSDTLDSLIGGHYTDKIKRYHIIDCRFDYEYAGGHIAGAINVKSIDAIDEWLLSESEGIHSNGDELPTPSRSGELDDGEQVVLVFHCEFSAKRAPTFAKHLRSRDRILNNALYPKIFYPEVYILEGGYCGFYQSRPERCDPQAYVPMDDPAHFQRRNSDLHDFRKFSRTRSFTYGERETQAKAASGFPPCPPLAFAAASAAQGRRNPSTSGLTIAEEEHDSSPCAFGQMGMGSPSSNSPCPRVVSLGQPPIFGSSKPRAFGFGRTASYAGTSTTHR
ncbi:M-phase inducer tyrosine phosphatase, partial [Tremellales sp. Uapishka_1]